MISSQSGKSLSVFGLVMINVIAIDSLRSIPFGAELGLSLISYYLIAAVLFFIPTAFVTAHLAGKWPNGGGVYTWVKAALGKRCAFVTIFMQWLYNLVWYPTILSLLVTTLFYLFDPQLATNPYWMAGSILTLYWLITWVNLRGIAASVKLSTVTAVLGTLLPMLLITLMGVIWWSGGYPLQLNFNWQDLLPNLDGQQNWAILPNVIFGLVGIEMSAVHVRDVRNPRKDYPRAVFYSTLIILATLICSSLAVAAIVPQQSFSLVSGLLDAFVLFCKAFGLGFLMPVVALLIVLGGIGGVGAWILGPAKALMVAAEDDLLPACLSKTNANQVPANLLIVQGLIFSLLTLAFVFMPSINSAYWLLSTMTAQLALFSYVFIFLAAIVLQWRQPSAVEFSSPWTYKVLCLLGLFGSAAMVLVGFVPPPESTINIGNTTWYELILSGGMVLSVLLPLFLMRRFVPPH